MLTSLSRHVPAAHRHTEHKKQLLSRDTGFHTTMVMATEQPWSESGGLSRMERTAGSSECIAHAFVTSVTSRHVWLKSRRSLTRRSLTGRSASGVCVWGHAFNKKDTLSIRCEAVDKTFTDHWLPAMLTSNFQRCISDVNKMDVVACFSKLLSHPSCLDVRLLCLKFHTKMTRFYWIIVICFGVHFLWYTVYNKNLSHRQWYKMTLLLCLVTYIDWNTVYSCILYLVAFRK